MTKRRSYLVLCTTLLLQPLTISAAESLTNQTDTRVQLQNAIVDRWRKYFLEVFTLKLQSDMFDSKNATTPAMSTRAVLSGRQFRVKTFLPLAGEDAYKYETAYNNDIYQTVTHSVGGGRRRLTCHRQPGVGQLDNTKATGVLLLPFLFVFPEKSTHNLETLREPRVWEELKKRISVAPAIQIAGQNQTTLIVNGAGDTSYTVTVDDVTGIPLRWTAISTKGKKSGALDSAHLNVAKTTAWLHDSGHEKEIRYFPTAVEYFRFDSDSVEKLYVAGNHEYLRIEADADSLEINTRIDEKVFTIPVSEFDKVTIE